MRWQCSGRVLGVDLAPRYTGLVVISETGLFLHSLTLHYPLVRKHKGDPPISEAQRIERMLAIANTIVGICKKWQIRYVGIEGYAMDARFQAHQIGEVAGVVKTQLFLALRMIPEVVPPQTARKHLMGYGRPDKKQVIEVVHDGLGWAEVKGDHEADAAVVGKYVFDMKVAEEKELSL